MPVKKYKQIDHEIAAHPGDKETTSEPLELQIGQNEFNCWTIKAYLAELNKIYGD